MTADSYIGKRLSFNGHLCTVRYIGKVTGTQGDWLGVEWDDPRRGKHSGEYNGTRYFDCVSGEPTAASFVRPNRPSDPRRDFLQAIRFKYAGEDADDGTSARGHSETKIITFGTKPAEEVGFDKIRKQQADLQELRIVILDGLGVCQRRRGRDDDDAAQEDVTRIRATCPKITEVELSRNLFEDWAEIASICEGLDKLRNLRADGNRFHEINLGAPEQRASKPVYEGLRSLSLQYSLLSWGQVTSIASTFTHLNHLLAGGNQLRQLTSAPLPASITVISLEENLFECLDDVRPLTHLPNLQKLVLKRNHIADIHSSTTTSPSPLIFPASLTDIDLSHNRIASWLFINTLPTIFPALTALRLSYNPLYDHLATPSGKPLGPDDGYMLTIARLAPLRTLNLSRVAPRERLDAESYYLSTIARELADRPEADAPAILAAHPRYKDLCAEYGAPVVDRAIGRVHPNALAARLVRFRFYLAGTAAEAAVRDGAPTRVEVEIPRRCSVYAVLGIAGKRFGIAPFRLRLVWETGEYEAKGREGGEHKEAGSVEEDEDEGSEDERERNMGEREVELIPSSRPAATWIDGHAAKVRVELRQ